MKLYIYDHCPFCVRVRLMAGILGLQLQEVILLNHDDATPISLIGAKQVPILLKEEGTAMGESLDIVRYLAELNHYEFNETVRDELQAWLDKVGKYHNHLVQPRSVLLGLPEFEQAEAVAYYTEKKSEKIGSFSENMANTKTYLNKINRDLNQLLEFLPELSDKIGLEDVLLFPILRNLTMVRGIEFPELIRNYLETLSQKSGVALYFDRAI